MLPFIAKYVCIVEEISIQKLTWKETLLKSEGTVLFPLNSTFRDDDYRLSELIQADSSILNLNSSTYQLDDLNKLTISSEAQFPKLENGNETCPSSRIGMKFKSDNVRIHSVHEGSPLPYLQKVTHKLVSTPCCCQKDSLAKKHMCLSKNKDDSKYEYWTLSEYSNTNYAGICFSLLFSC